MKTFIVMPEKLPVCLPPSVTPIGVLVPGMRPLNVSPRHAQCGEKLAKMEQRMDERFATVTKTVEGISKKPTSPTTPDTPP